MTMLNMSEQSEKFLKQHVPKALDKEDVNDALDLIDSFITAKGLDMDPETHDFGPVNNLGREAYRVYDDLFANND